MRIEKLLKRWCDVFSEIRFSTLGNRAKNESYEEGLYFDQDVLIGPFRIELSNHSV